MRLVKIVALFLFSLLEVENAMSLSFEEVIPDNPNWIIFLNKSVEYVSENWGLDLPEEQFKVEYDKELRIRIQEGGRLLYLIKEGEEYVGFFNAYVVDNGIDGHKTMFIAEFCIFDQFRRRHFGTQVFAMILTLAHERGVRTIAAHVDRDRPISNAFWRTLLENLDGRGERNLYWRNIIPQRPAVSFFMATK